jgi:hypothetical protein
MQRNYVMCNFAEKNYNPIQPINFKDLLTLNGAIDMYFEAIVIVCLVCIRR